MSAPTDAAWVYSEAGRAFRREALLERSARFAIRRAELELMRAATLRALTCNASADACSRRAARWAHQAATWAAELRALRETRS